MVCNLTHSLPFPTLPAFALRLWALYTVNTIPLRASSCHRVLFGYWTTILVIYLYMPSI
jgi:hypothetical protein